MNMTHQDFFDVFTPLLLALHEKKVLDLAELPHYYEDVVARRRLEKKEDEAALVFQASLIPRLQKLADWQKKRDQRLPPTA